MSVQEIAAREYLQGNALGKVTPKGRPRRQKCPGCIWGNKVSGVCTQPRCIKGLEEGKHG